MKLWAPDTTLEKALYKAFEASYLHLPTLVTLYLPSLMMPRKALDLSFNVVMESLATGQQPLLCPSVACKPAVGKIGDDDQDHPKLCSQRKNPKLSLTQLEPKQCDEDGEQIRRSAIEHESPLFTA